MIVYCNCRTGSSRNHETTYCNTELKLAVGQRLPLEKDRTECPISLKMTSCLQYYNTTSQGLMRFDVFTVIQKICLLENHQRPLEIMSSVTQKARIDDENCFIQWCLKLRREIIIHLEDVYQQWEWWVSRVARWPAQVRVMSAHRLLERYQQNSGYSEMDSWNEWWISFFVSSSVKLQAFHAPSQSFAGRPDQMPALARHILARIITCAMVVAARPRLHHIVNAEYNIDDCYRWLLVDDASRKHWILTQ